MVRIKKNAEKKKDKQKKKRKKRRDAKSNETGVFSGKRSMGLSSAAKGEGKWFK